MTEIAALTGAISELRATVDMLCKKLGARLSRAEVCERIGRDESTLRRWVREGRFPTPATDGRWLLDEVLEWERSQPSKRAIDRASAL